MDLQIPGEIRYAYNSELVFWNFDEMNFGYIQNKYPEHTQHFNSKMHAV